MFIFRNDMIGETISINALNSESEVQDDKVSEDTIQCKNFWAKTFNWMSALVVVFAH